MPAKILHQRESVKDLFRQKIKEKIPLEKETLKADLDQELPSWLDWALKPASSLVFDLQQRRDSLVGRGGEIGASLNFSLMLPGNWILINDVVLEPQREESIQIDHVLIGSPVPHRPFDFTQPPIIDFSLQSKRIFYFDSLRQNPQLQYCILLIGECVYKWR
ncbi:MAG: hypothetical protein QW315_06875 [Candidatus Hadarchaeum sp.]